jgi:outer membrane protein TolC
MTNDGLRDRTQRRAGPGRAACWGLVFLAQFVIRHSSLATEAPLPPKTNGVYVIDLPSTLRLAGARNVDIQIANEKLAEARANNESATFQFFPWLGVGVGWRRHDNLIQNVEGKIIDVHKDSYSVGPALTAQVDLGDAIFKKLAARQNVKAADFALEAQRQDSLLAAAQGYFDLVRAHGAVGVAEEAIRISTNFAEQVQQAVGLGIAFKGDLLRVQVQTERYLLTLRQTLEQRGLVSARLAQTLHLDPAVELVSKDSDLVPLALVETNATLEALVTEAFATRPELKQSQAQIEAARQTHRGALYGPLVPSLGAQVFVGGLGGGSDGSAARFGESEDYQLTLGWRLGPGGLFDRGRVHASQSRLNIARLTSDKLTDEITRQVVEGHTRSQSLADQLMTARRALQFAEETLRLTRERKQFGVGAVLEDIQAEQELTKLRLDYLNALAEYNKTQYFLSKAVGRLPMPARPTPRLDSK